MPGKLDYPLGYKQKDLSAISTSKTGAAKSAHTVVQATKHSHPEKMRFAKPHRTDQITSSTHELEATVSDFYRYLLGPGRAPKTRAVKKYGVLSTAIEGGYLSYHEAHCLQDKRTTPEELVQRGMGSILAANYLMEENDCHWGNFGFNGAGKLARIDFDLSLGSITFGEGIKRISGGPPTEFNFSKVDAYDLNHLSNPRTFKPYNAPLHMGHGRSSGPTCFLTQPLGVKIIAAEAGDVVFQFDKWKTLLKATVLSQADLEKTFAAHFTDPILVEKYAQLLHKRFQTIAHTLARLPEFQAFFQQYGEKLFTAVQQDIHIYNQEFKKHPRRVIQIDYSNTIFKNIFEKQQREIIAAQQQKLAEQVRVRHERMQQELARIQAAQEIKIREHQEKIRLEAEAKIQEQARMREQERLRIEMEQARALEARKVAEEQQRIALETQRVQEKLRQQAVDLLPKKLLPNAELQLTSEKSRREQMRSQQEYIAQQDKLFNEHITLIDQTENPPTKLAGSSRQKDILIKKLCGFAKQFSPIPSTPVLMNVTELSKIIDEVRTALPQITERDSLHEIIRSISIILNNIEEREKNIAEELKITSEQTRTYQRELFEIDKHLHTTKEDIGTMQNLADAEHIKLKAFSKAHTILQGTISQKKRINLAEIISTYPEIAAIAKELHFSPTQRSKAGSFFHKIFTRISGSSSDKVQLLQLIQKKYDEELLSKRGAIIKTLERFKVDYANQQEKRSACVAKIEAREANESFIFRQQKMLKQPEMVSWKAQLNMLKTEAHMTVRRLVEPRNLAGKPPRAPKLIGGRQKQ